MKVTGLPAPTRRPGSHRASGGKRCAFPGTRKPKAWQEPGRWRQRPADGTAQDVEVDGPAHPEFAQLALDAVKQRRFVPAKCGDVPVPVELWLQLDWNI